MAVDRAGEARQSVSAYIDPTQLKALKRAIQDAGKEARRSVRARLKEAGTVVAVEIKSRTPVGRVKTTERKRVVGATLSSRMGKGGATRTAAHGNGLLKRSTKLRMGSLSVAVYNDARAVSRKYPGGYRYGKRIEFDPSYSSRYAFFYPGFDASKDQALKLFDKLLDDITREYLRG